ncbi:unnamed protein product [Brassica oleracea]
MAIPLGIYHWTSQRHKIVKAGAGRNPHGCAWAVVFRHRQKRYDKILNLFLLVVFLFTIIMPGYISIVPFQFNMKDSSVKLAYEAQPRPKAIASLAGETIVKVACGANHTVAVDKNGFVYTWGFGGYGRLAWGHRQHPRRIDVFQRHNVLPPNAIVSAGSANSACGGQLYMWGKIKNNGDDWMYPKPMKISILLLMFDFNIMIHYASGWNLRWMDSGSMHHFVGADSSCISWGHAQYGELGYGPNAPKKVDLLEGMHAMGVACGLSHSLVIVNRTDITDHLEQLEIYDGKGSLEFIPPYRKIVLIYSCHTAKRSASKKRKASKASSDSEQDGNEENSDKEKEAKGSDSDYSDDDGEEEANGKKQSTRGRGRGRGGRGRGGRTGNRKASPVKTSGRRGRPRKS